MPLVKAVFLSIVWFCTMDAAFVLEGSDCKYSLFGSQVRCLSERKPDFSYHPSGLVLCKGLRSVLLYLLFQTRWKATTF